jgi:hypothetical protein
VTVDGTALGADVTDPDARVFDVSLYSNENGDEFVNPEQLMSANEAVAWCDAGRPRCCTRAKRRLPDRHCDGGEKFSVAKRRRALGRMWPLSLSG